MHPVLKLDAQRLSLGILLLFAASALLFGLTEILPGDAAQAQLGQSATPENLAKDVCVMRSFSVIIELCPKVGDGVIRRRFEVA